MRAAAGGDGLLPCQFGAAVNVERPGGIGLLIRAGFGAVENVVGGVVNQQAAGAGQLFGDASGCNRVDGVRQLGLALGLVDSGVGGGVDDDVGREIANGLRGRFRIGEIDLAARAGNHFTQRSESALQLPSDLSGGFR